MTDGAAPDLSRIVVVGTSCSGKTTFARELSGRLGVPHIELDALHWLPGWVEREPDEFLALIDENTAGSHWVTDGNYRKARDVLWSRATTIIWLDYGFPLVFWRSLKRTFHRAFTGQEVCNGNVESWWIAFFSRHSIILWVITTYRGHRRRYDALFAANDHPQAAKIRLSSPRATRAFLTSIPPC